MNLPKLSIKDLNFLIKDLGVTDSESTISKLYQNRNTTFISKEIFTLLNLPSQDGEINDIEKLKFMIDNDFINIKDLLYIFHQKDFILTEEVYDEYSMDFLEYVSNGRYASSYDFLLPKYAEKYIFKFIRELA